MRSVQVYGAVFVSMNLLASVGCNTPDKESPKELFGQFRSIHGESGENSFGVSFVVPPKVELGVPRDGSPQGASAVAKTILVETTKTGFKWKNTGDKTAEDGLVNWKATGKVIKD